MGTSRRTFLSAGAAGLTTSLAAFDPAAAHPADEPRQGLLYAQPKPNGMPAGRPLKVAALASTYHYLSHAYHIVGRFLDGFVVHEPPVVTASGKASSGVALRRPASQVVSLYIEQINNKDLGVAKARKFGVRQSPTIADALTLGTGSLAVDAILLIAEHGDYPTNEKLQKLYPRGKYFFEAAEIIRKAGRGIPIFVDKHLSYDRAEAARMVDTARELGCPLMAGSSLPVTWRLPTLEIPLNTPMKEAVVASRGEIEIFGFHALETLQCMVERRDRQGKPQGVAAVTCLEADDVWKAGDSGRWSWPLFDEALGRSHTLNPGDVRQNTRDFDPPPGRPTFLRHPVGFEVEYVDGLKATAILANGHVDDTSFAADLADSASSRVSTLVYLPAPPGANFFTPLTLRIEDFFQSDKPPYPAERTQLTGGILDAALTSRLQGHARIETPDLATIDYQAPADSGFIRTAVADPRPNRYP